MEIDQTWYMDSLDYVDKTHFFFLLRARLRFLQITPHRLIAPNTRYSQKDVP